MRPPEEMLAFWPVADPARRRHVCRPSLQRPEVPSCFRDVVGPANVHAIALATYATGGLVTRPAIAPTARHESFVPAGAIA